ncbi:EexN family lipoprotein [Marinomonas ostreistagni]|uniref:EexN family lipoprotein n=1 Tax=Marinomonas ostreistagni TaxID=359209 RepID=UPI00194E6161|nr:EexN family lipoprotein [Marinomonas ostreistagni]MBM6549893.1 EexN family lipoprotein [Marinomonas ostreistagni]
MKKLLLAVPFTMLLTACGPASVEDLMEDPEQLVEVLEECGMKMAQGKDTDTEECNNAREAQNRMAVNVLRQFMQQ